MPAEGGLEATESGGELVILASDVWVGLEGVAPSRSAWMSLFSY